MAHSVPYMCVYKQDLGSFVNDLRKAGEKKPTEKQRITLSSIAENR